MNTVHKCFFVGLISARSSLAYAGEVIGRSLFLVTVLYIFLQLWKVTYREMQTDTMNGLSLPQMLLYLTITESILLSGPRVAQLIDEEVRTGSLAISLVRPLAYPLYRFAITIGERFVRFFFVAVTGWIVLLCLVGPVSVPLSGVALFAIALPLAFAIDFLGSFMIGTCAFWFEDTSGLFLIYSRMTMILGGMLIPLNLFPQNVQPILKALPFSAMVNGPAEALLHGSFEAFPQLVLRQVVALFVFGIIAFFLYRAGLQRISANGG
jgi:ABC-2 type transport system permease protein